VEGAGPATGITEAAGCAGDSARDRMCTTLMAEVPYAPLGLVLVQDMAAVRTRVELCQVPPGFGSLTWVKPRGGA
jgi:hypothetical protein